MEEKHSKELCFFITEEWENARIDKALSDLIDSLSRSHIQKLLKDGMITVNQTAVKANCRLKCDDEIKVMLPPAASPDILPENIPLDILYEDDDVLVVNKPKGMVVHPAAGHLDGTLVNAVMYHCQGNLSGINGIMRPGIVHRIDKDTTGSVIICKNDFSHNHIAAQLKEHSVVRRYHAICYGVPQNPTGTISIGHPLLGDELYSGGRKSPFRLEGQCLHAKILGFIHPSTSKYIETDAPLPAYFQHLLANMK
ncbi:MAG: RluA family pseudouridine synthase [Lachnospiraceae bacterium]|nr:RluA family pseudouridine synthase [Lachnospiraceae bacterium]